MSNSLNGGEAANQRTDRANSFTRKYQQFRIDKERRARENQDKAAAKQRASQARENLGHSNFQHSDSFGNTISIGHNNTANTVHIPGLGHTDPLDEAPEVLPKEKPEISQEKILLIKMLLEVVLGESLETQAIMTMLDALITGNTKPPVDKPVDPQPPIVDPQPPVTGVIKGDDLIKDGALDEVNVSSKEELEHSEYKIDLYKNQKEGLKELLETWKGVDDPTGKARGEVVRIKAQINLVDSATKFWETREDSWSEKNNDYVNAPGNNNVKNDISKNREQLVNLENLMDQWIGVEDDSGAARGQVAQTRAQINLFEANDDFLVNMDEFWQKESQAGYSPEDATKVKRIYQRIEDNTKAMSSVLLAESDANGIQIYNRLEADMKRLEEIRQDNQFEHDLHTPYVGNSINSAEEMAHTSYKVELYEDNKVGLNNLLDQWISVEDNSGAARQQISGIRTQLNQVDIAIDEWKHQEDFWKELHEAGMPPSEIDGKPAKNAQYIDKLAKDLTKLQDKFDQNVSIQDDSGVARGQVAEIRAQMRITELAIKTMHPGMNDDGKARIVNSQEDLDKLLLKANDDTISIHPGEESAHASFKKDLSKAQMTGLEDLMDQWISVEDNSGAARSQVAQIRAQINLTNQSLSFWNKREEVWNERDLSYTLGLEDANDAHKNAAFKVDLYRSQETGLEDLMDQWMSVEDNSGAARGQVAETRAQLNRVGSANNFWESTVDFWQAEQDAKYPPETQAMVDSFYKSIDMLSGEIDKILLGEESNMSMAELAFDLQEQQVGLAELRQSGHHDQNIKIPFNLGGVSAAEESAHSAYKKELLGHQLTGLEDLMDQWAASDKPGARKEVKNIRKQINKTRKQQKFWKQQEKFWNKVDQKGIPEIKDPNQAFDTASLIVELEQKVDMHMNDDSFHGKVQLEKFKAELEAAKAQLLAY